MKSWFNAGVALVCLLEQQSACAWAHPFQDDRSSVHAQLLRGLVNGHMRRLLISEAPGQPYNFIARSTVILALDAGGQRPFNSYHEVSADAQDVLQAFNDRSRVYLERYPSLMVAMPEIATIALDTMSDDNQMRTELLERAFSMQIRFKPLRYDAGRHDLRNFVNDDNFAIATMHHDHALASWLGANTTFLPWRERFSAITSPHFIAAANRQNPEVMFDGFNRARAVAPTVLMIQSHSWAPEAGFGREEVLDYFSQQGLSSFEVKVHYPGSRRLMYSIDLIGSCAMELEMRRLNILLGKHPQLSFRRGLRVACTDGTPEPPIHPPFQDEL